MSEEKPLTQEEKRENLKNIILEKAKENKVVFSTFDGYMFADLDEFIDQPATGILYDLNRLGETALTFLDDPKWVNDFAVGLVIEKLKSVLDEKDEMIKSLLKELNEQ